MYTTAPPVFLSGPYCNCLYGQERELRAHKTPHSTSRSVPTLLGCHPLYHDSHIWDISLLSAPLCTVFIILWAVRFWQQCKRRPMDCSLSIKHCPDVLSDKAQVIFGLSLCYCASEANRPVLQATITHTETKCAVFTGTDDILPLRLSSFTGHGDKGITCQEEPNIQNSNKCEIKSMLWVLEHHIYLHLCSFK